MFLPSDLGLHRGHGVRSVLIRRATAVGFGISTPAGGHPVPTDRRAIAALVAANLFTLALAWVQQWPLGVLLWPYWVQSVIIGVFNYRRIMALREFSTEGFTINRRSVAPTDKTRRTTARFFALHYGIFHAVYALFLGVTSRLSALDWWWVGAAAAVFLFNHWQSFERFREADRQGRPNIGTLMFLPYLRVVPMHLMVIIGIGAMGSGALALLLFGVLKTAADCAMHIAEHRILAAAGRSVS